MQLPSISQFRALGRTLATALAIALASVAVLITACSTALAMNASPHAFEEAQPDGTPVRLHIRGNEHYHWLEDMDGYTVLLDEPSREYRYARRNPDGRLGPTQFLAGKDNPANAGLTRRARPTEERIREREFNRRGELGGGPQLAEGATCAPEREGQDWHRALSARLQHVLQQAVPGIASLPRLEVASAPAHDDVARLHELRG